MAQQPQASTSSSTAQQPAGLNPAQQQQALNTVATATISAMFEQAATHFRGAVHVNARRAYKKFISDIKTASLSFVPDLQGADEEEVLASIQNPTNLYFITDIAFKHKIARERESVALEQDHVWSDEVNKLIENLHYNAAETAHFLHNMHVCLSLIKEKVSDDEYVKIMSTVTLPLTTVEVIKYTDKKATANVDEDRIRYHFPNARKFQGRPVETSLFACLVHYIMRLKFINDPKAQLSYNDCATLFGVSVSALRRVFTGVKRMGGAAYKKGRVAAASAAAKAKADQEKQLAKQKKEQAAASSSAHPRDEENQLICRFCGKTFTNDHKYGAHIRKHLETVRTFDCLFCGKKYEVFSELLAHQSTHAQREFVCHVC